jgi:hypothetical protein
MVTSSGEGAVLGKGKGEDNVSWNDANFTVQKNEKIYGVNSAVTN